MPNETISLAPLEGRQGACLQFLQSLVATAFFPKRTTPQPPPHLIDCTRRVPSLRTHSAWSGGGLARRLHRASWGPCQLMLNINYLPCPAQQETQWAALSPFCELHTSEWMPQLAGIFCGPVGQWAVCPSTSSSSPRRPVLSAQQSWNQCTQWVHIFRPDWTTPDAQSHVSKSANPHSSAVMLAHWSVRAALACAAQGNPSP